MMLNCQTLNAPDYRLRAHSVSSSEKSSEHVGSLASIYGLNPQTLAHRHVTSHAHGAALCLLCLPVSSALRPAHDVSQLERHESLPDPP